MNKQKHFLGMAASFAAHVIFGFSYIFSKLALDVASPLVILAVRFTVSFAVLNLLLLTGKFKISLAGKPKKKLFLMAVAQPFLYFIFELFGLSLVSSALTGVIISLIPVTVLIFSRIFLGEKTTALQTLCAVCSILGIAGISYLSNDSAGNHVLGIVLLLCAVICATAFNILSRSEAAVYSAFERTYMMFLISSVGFNLIAFVSLKGQFIPQVVTAFSSGKFIIAILYLAVLSSVGAFLLYNYSTSQISVVQSSSFANIVTVVSVLAGVFILGEKLTGLQVVCCVVILLGVFGVNAAPRRKQ